MEWMSEGKGLDDVPEIVIRVPVDEVGESQEEWWYQWINLIFQRVSFIT